jgi:integrase/recombinase XerD
MSELSLQRALGDPQLVALWLHGQSPATQRVYGPDVRRFLAAIDKPLATVRLGELQDFADTLGALAPATQARILSRSSRS